MSTKHAKTITIGPVRISYHNLITPYSQTGSADDNKYSLTMLIPKTNQAAKNAIDAAIEAAVREAVQGKWNGSAPVSLTTPLHDGDGPRPNGEKYGGECFSCYVMTANSKQKPEIVDANLQPLIDAKDIYSGMWVYVSINFFAYMRSGKKGVGCGLGPVMKFKDGEPLGGKVTAKKAFAAIMKPAVLNDGGDSDNQPQDGARQ